MIFRADKSIYSFKTDEITVKEILLKDTVLTKVNIIK